MIKQSEFRSRKLSESNGDDNFSEKIRDNRVQSRVDVGYDFLRSDPRSEHSSFRLDAIEDLISNDIKRLESNFDASYKGYVDKPPKPRKDPSTIGIGSRMTNGIGLSDSYLYSSIETLGSSRFRDLLLHDYRSDGITQITNSFAAASSPAATTNSVDPVESTYELEDMSRELDAIKSKLSALGIVLGDKNAMEGEEETKTKEAAAIPVLTTTISAIPLDLHTQLRPFYEYYGDRYAAEDEKILKAKQEEEQQVTLQQQEEQEQCEADELRKRMEEEAQQLEIDRENEVEQLEAEELQWQLQEVEQLSQRNSIDMIHENLWHGRCECETQRYWSCDCQVGKITTETDLKILQSHKNISSVTMAVSLLLDSAVNTLDSNLPPYRDILHTRLDPTNRYCFTCGLEGKCSCPPKEGKDAGATAAFSVPKIDMPSVPLLKSNVESMSGQPHNHNHSHQQRVSVTAPASVPTSSTKIEFDFNLGGTRPLKYRNPEPHPGATSPTTAATPPHQTAKQSANATSTPTLEKLSQQRIRVKPVVAAQEQYYVPLKCEMQPAQRVVIGGCDVQLKDVRYVNGKKFAVYCR